MTGRPTPKSPGERLVEWFAQHRRDLPWRGDTDPYHILVSEFMLHQTRVNVVIPFYQRFLQRFPSFSALADARPDEVLKAWEGLGYYARARNLHALAKVVCNHHGGKLPPSRSELLALPGIGEYTANAVLSIAFGTDVPAIDGNARRVLSRLRAIEGDVSKAEGMTRVLNVARELLPPGNAAAFNQALMDLGAQICTPRNPNCDCCPWEDDCAARRMGNPTHYPARRARKPLPHYDVSAGVIWREDRLLIAQRPMQGLLGGLWEFPGGKLRPGETIEQCTQREIEEKLGIQVQVGEPIARVDHAYTHFRITLHAFHCSYRSGEPRCNKCMAWRWVTPAQLDAFAFPAADRLVIRTLTSGQIPHAGP